MPAKHVVKTYDAPAFYHVYNRASGERLLFRDDDDRRFFLELLERHLLEAVVPDDDNPEQARVYDLQVAAYCLMGTHFHLLLYQQADTEAISGFMRSVGTTYAMFYNSKYKSKGHVFQSSFRASHVDDESYLAYITIYIHLNPRNYKTWPWSSYAEYLGAKATYWIHPELVLEDTEIGERYKKLVGCHAQTDKRIRYDEFPGLVEF